MKTNKKYSVSELKDVMEKTGGLRASAYEVSDDLDVNFDFENKCGNALYGEYQDSVKKYRVSDEAYISAPESTVKVALIPTNEELMIAIDTMNITKAL